MFEVAVEMIVALGCLLVPIGYLKWLDRQLNEGYILVRKGAFTGGKPAAAAREAGHVKVGPLGGLHKVRTAGGKALVEEAETLLRTTRPTEPPAEAQPGGVSAPEPVVVGMA